ncbi:MAG: hypothetical protein HQL33_09520 [Alphaproteobacteria bacterium]|nr:hypothetical protein [Alphaproteobacteria bacterium]
MAEKKKYTREEIQAAWEKASVMAEFNPNEVRIDKVLTAGSGGPTLRRTEFQGSGQGAWVIDDQGRAREKNYAVAEALLAEQKRETAARQAAAERRMAKFKAQAEEAGIPSAWIVFERLADLEDLCAAQQAQIDRLNETISNR